MRVAIKDIQGCNLRMVFPFSNLYFIPWNLKKTKVRQIEVLFFHNFFYSVPNYFPIRPSTQHTHATPHFPVFLSFNNFFNICFKTFAILTNFFSPLFPKICHFFQPSHLFQPFHLFQPSNLFQPFYLFQPFQTLHQPPHQPPH